MPEPQSILLPISIDEPNFSLCEIFFSKLPIVPYTLCHLHLHHKS